MGLQNLRNKYNEHPVIKPLIEHCDRNDMGFELIKETRQIGLGFKSFKYAHYYYLIIGNELIEEIPNFSCWTDLFKTIAKAYEYLGLEYPETLIKAARAFKKNIGSG